MENLLKELIRNEEMKSKKYILFMLLKFSNLIQTSQDPSHDMPLLVIDQGKFMLVYPDETLGGMGFVFTDHDEILTVLQKTFFDCNTIFLDYNPAHNRQDEHYLWQKIDEAIEADDEEAFLQYAQQLQKFQ